jgi:hypothetical protein
MNTTHIGTSADPITYLLTAKGERAAVPAPRWDCTDHGPLTVAQALDVLRTHSTCDCRISRVARKVRAQVIDAPTVRSQTPRTARRVRDFYPATSGDDGEMLARRVRARLIDAPTVRAIRIVPEVH